MKRRVARHEVVQPLDTSYRCIPLTQGLNATVDARDFEWLSQWDWFARKERHCWYAVRNFTKPDGTQGCIRMHRAILGIGDPAIFVDHRDREGLNNRRENIRQAKVSQNNSNTRKLITNTSGYRGVSPTGKSYRLPWKAQISHQNIKISIGTFANKEEAAKAYDDVAIKLHGEFAHLNFPTSSHREL